MYDTLFRCGIGTRKTFRPSGKRRRTASRCNVQRTYRDRAIYRRPVGAPLTSFREPSRDVVTSAVRTDVAAVIVRRAIALELLQYRVRCLLLWSIDQFRMSAMSPTGHVQIDLFCPVCIKSYHIMPLIICLL